MLSSKYTIRVLTNVCYQYIINVEKYTHIYYCPTSLNNDDKNIG